MFRRLFLICSLVLAGVACQRTTPAASRPNPKLLVLGHAGSGFFTPISPFNFRPPSSMLGVQHALNLGADGVEVDIQLSQDSVPMLYHNLKLDNMTNGQGCIGEHPAAELTKLRYHGGWPYDWFQHERLITFDTLLANFQRRPTFPYIHLDLHEDEQCVPENQAFARVPTLVRQLASRLRRYQVPPERVLILSQHVSTVRQFRVALPQVPLGLEITGDFEVGLRQAQAEKVQAVVLDADKATPAQAAQAHAAGLQVVLFGGRSAGNIQEVLRCQPDMMEVDNVRRLLLLQGRR